ncbi:amidohydrolase 2 [Mycena rebaudengoi]|nr:amidohydrolase 2 [Mycena rebaudengoi]
MTSTLYPDLHRSCFSFPAIDNHAHSLLAEAHRSKYLFENVISEADGDASADAVHTIAAFRAVPQLGTMLGIQNPTWDSIKATRAEIPYIDLCKMFMRPTGIQARPVCILIDDGLGGIAEFAEKYAWHDQFTTSSTKRIVRVEIVAENILKPLLAPQLGAGNLDIVSILDSFNVAFEENLASSATDPAVAGFKSIACYRTGLDVSPSASSEEALHTCLRSVAKSYQETGLLRLAHKALNDHIVRMTLEMAGKHKKPVQFHTGLGDNDITLNRSSPSHLQDVIKAYPKTLFVLLHSSYPFTRESGYLSAVYSNVFLDFGEVFPIVSGGGQRSIIRQILELCPTNKILFSTDGHWWPESYYLGTIQAREALFAVLSEIVASGELLQSEAVAIVENALFHNSNKLYNLGLEPNLAILE